MNENLDKLAYNLQREIHEKSFGFPLNETPDVYREGYMKGIEYVLKQKNSLFGTDYESSKLILKSFPHELRRKKWVYLIFSKQNG